MTTKIKIGIVGSRNYTDKKYILYGLKNFYDVAKFTTSEKPAKRQKRNDYED